MDACKFCGATGKYCYSRYIGHCHRFEEQNQKEAKLKRQPDVSERVEKDA